MYEYACIARTARGGRCRNKAGTNDVCAAHSEAHERASPPDVVLLKFSIAPQRAIELELAGVERRPADWVQREEQHLAHARTHGREPYRYRDVADSGVPVFGKEGLILCSVQSAWDEMIDKGYYLVDLHIIQRRDRKMDILVLSLSKNGAKLPFPSPRAEEMIRSLIGSGWGYVHVWANPPQEDGTVVHTVNCVHRNQTRRVQLSFENGLWGINP